MNGLKKLLAGSLISAFPTSVFVLFASTSNAATFPAFDHMDSYAQAEFIADMVDRTEKALRDDGKPDLALKTEQLFTLVEPGDKMSVGLSQFELDMARARLADARRIVKNPAAKRLDVEDALFVTLKRNGIELSSNAMNAVIHALSSFQQMSNAEFHARTPAAQRHIVKSFAEIGFPDYCFRDMVKTKKSSVFGLGDDNVRNLTEIMSTQFPNSGNQPGFAHVAIAVETENLTAPDHVGPFDTLIVYVLTELQKRMSGQIKGMVDWSVLLPDGRHAYVGDDGVFWVVPDDDSKYKEGSSYKLEANLQPLAQRLSHCMESSGITDGARAQTVCLERVAGVRPPSTAPAAATPPPATAPSSPPASSSDDDPIGSGGFITPPNPH